MCDVTKRLLSDHASEVYAQPVLHSSSFQHQPPAMPSDGLSERRGAGGGAVTSHTRKSHEAEAKSARATCWTKLHHFPASPLARSILAISAGE